MKTQRTLGRRRFLQDSTTMLGAGALLSTPGTAAPRAEGPAIAGDDLRLRARFEPGQTVWILVPTDSDFKAKLAARELARGLRNLGLASKPILAAGGSAAPVVLGVVFQLEVQKQAFKHLEGYEIACETDSGNPPRLRLRGATSQALLYAVFDFLERQGAFFGLDGEIYPLQGPRALNLPPVNQPWQAQPRFSVRGLVPWPDFLNCITVFNREDFRAYLEAMLRMRFNTLGIHVYSGANQWAESFLSFEYAGAGHLAFTDTSATHRWGYLPERTSRFGMGGGGFYDSEVFGSEATTRARNPWEAAELAQQLWGEAFRYADQLGIRTGVGFEPYQIPDEIFRATPPEARVEQKDPNMSGPRLDPESVAARDILETRLGRLLDTYPTVSYVWLWEDEGMSWASQKTGVPLSVTPFRQAYDFLKRHAPEKRLVISGWGGVVRHFAAFHRQLPEEIIFSSLSDNLGWDPVSEEFAKLEGRERWPIPWLEDDPAMWLPQFHAHRFVRDMNRAADFGCQGLLGIHWRHRIMDINAGFQSRYSWDRTLQSEQYYSTYTRALVRPPAAEKLSALLNETDRDRRILCSFTGEIKDGHHQIHEYSGDYNEAFQFWNGYEPGQGVKDSQKEVAARLRSLAESAAGLERERLNYLARHVEFLVPYAESWSLALHLHQILQQAAELKKQGKNQDARQTVAAEGVPLWLKLAPLVREAILDFQEIVSTRNDLGTLASIHNKYERLALFRLRASMKEFLGELPPETETLLEEIRRPDFNAAARVFVPTRPTILGAGERVRILAVAPSGGPVTRATIFSRTAGADIWRAGEMKLVGRRTFEAEIHAAPALSPLLDYYIQAEFASGTTKLLVTSPLGAPSRFYTLTLV